MKKNFYTNCVVAIATIVAMSSCASSLSTLSRNAKELSTNGAINQTAVTMDVEVGDKVSYERVFKYGDNNYSKSSRNEANEIDIATAELLSKYGGDVLVERRYTVDYVSQSKTATSTVKVEGYVGKYKNFRTTEAATTGDKK